MARRPSGRVPQRDVQYSPLKLSHIREVDVQRWKYHSDLALGWFLRGATLNHFFSLHYLLPYLLVGASILHLGALHQYGSNNPLGINSYTDKIASYPYYYVKDLVGWVAFAIFSSIFIFYDPNVLWHPDNYYVFHCLLLAVYIASLHYPIL